MYWKSPDMIQLTTHPIPQKFLGCFHRKISYFTYINHRYYSLPSNKIQAFAHNHDSTNSHAYQTITITFSVPLLARRMHPSQGGWWAHQAGEEWDGQTGHEQGRFASSILLRNPYTSSAACHQRNLKQEQHTNDKNDEADMINEKRILHSNTDKHNYMCTM